MLKKYIANIYLGPNYKGLIAVNTSLKHKISKRQLQIMNHTLAWNKFTMSLH